MLDLSGRVAVVTGGSRGIGRAIAGRLVSHGASVVVAARTGADVERTAAELAGSARGRVEGVACDVRRWEECRALIERTLAAFGRLDILVNNAGVGVFAPLETMGLEEWRRQIQTNLDGVFHCCRAALPHLVESQGWVINIGSLAGRNAFAGGTAYNASKFGLIGFSEALMLEVRHKGVRVACVMPGSVATEFGSDAEAGGSDWKLHPEDIAEAVCDLLAFPARALPSRIEIRPSRPKSS
ncbi:MAG TPA: SDR family oxidoreductase [Thermoanaerobaculaceae bacterium]|nr:SDR family oxidoreductase [Thermoanaerobaculaceae bacterium]